MMNWFIPTPVIAAGIYLVGLGIAALFQPLKAEAFLARFASSARAHRGARKGRSQAQPHTQRQDVFRWYGASIGAVGERGRR